jgi:hypothetical protein
VIWVAALLLAVVLDVVPDVVLDVVMLLALAVSLVVAEVLLSTTATAALLVLALLVSALLKAAQPPRAPTIATVIRPDLRLATSCSWREVLLLMIALHRSLLCGRALPDKSYHSGEICRASVELMSKGYRIEQIKLT